MSARIRPSELSLPTVGLSLFAVAVLCFLLLPIVVAIYLSFGDATVLEFPVNQLSGRLYAEFFSQPAWRDPFVASIAIAFGTGSVSTIVAVAAGYALQSIGPRGRMWLVAIFTLPMILPVIVIAVGQVFFLSEFGLLASSPGMILSQLSVSLPPALLLVFAMIWQRGLREEDIAASLGSGRLYRLVRVTIPIYSAAIVGAFLLAFLTSFDESVLSLFIGGATIQTLPRKIFDGIRYDLDPVVTVAASLSFLAWLLVTSLWLISRRPERSVRQSS